MNQWIALSILCSSRSDSHWFLTIPKNQEEKKKKIQDLKLNIKTNNHHVPQFWSASWNFSSSPSKLPPTSTSTTTHTSQPNTSTQNSAKMDSPSSSLDQSVDLSKLSDKDKQELQQFVVNESQKARIQQSLFSFSPHPLPLPFLHFYKQQFEDRG